MVRRRLLLGEAEKGFDVFEPALGPDQEHAESPTSDEVVDRGPPTARSPATSSRVQQSPVHKRVHKPKRLRGLSERF